MRPGLKEQWRLYIQASFSLRVYLNQVPCKKILNEWDSKPFEKPSVVLPILAGVLDELKQGLKWFSANSMSSPSEVDINGHAIKISPLEKNIIATCLQTSTYQ
ncbi:hypothetical protein DSO57_1003620 [Entomophthora muscae]|uniref:Uncharacterized protein n=1 Tax=Entomophthora muscae TaxID=34485 RepID=A0ACC2SL26_9FUNG|nr:hypothetical protein DSO57_1003620 [Entomophthora muscae]